MNTEKTGDITDYLTPVNVFFILANIAVFLFVDLTHDSENTEWVLKCGAMYWPYVMERGEYYRLFTSMFLHFGVDHIVNNMLVLFFLGGTLEKLMVQNSQQAYPTQNGIIGNIKYLFLYIISGIVAGLASMGYNMLVSQDPPVCAGASGAIFGVTGALLYVVIINRGRIRDFSRTQMLFFTVLCLYNGFTSESVDNAAHVGGFVNGFILAALLYHRRSQMPDQKPLDQE